MLYKKQSLNDFFEMVERAKKDYQNSKDNYEWNYKFSLDQYGETKHFTITNQFQSQVIQFNEDTKIIIQTIISDAAFEKIKKLKEGL